MPELPEVETIKRQLTPDLIGKKIIKSFSSGKRLRREIPNFNPLIGQFILNIFRRNKYLILETNNFWVVIHLGMTGKLIIESIENIKKHTHFLLSLNNNIFLSYEDARRFGSLDLFEKSLFKNYLDIPIFKNLGIEPLEKQFTLALTKKLITGTSLEIKKFLMDSNKICGIGNIYANEILFLSKINPKIKGKDLTKNEINLIYKNIIKVLNKAISLGGSSISDFVHTNGSKGSMQDNYYVYARENKPCKICKTPILKLIQAGRSSFFCPNCQPF